MSPSKSRHFLLSAQKKMREKSIEERHIFRRTALLKQMRKNMGSEYEQIQMRVIGARLTWYYYTIYRKASQVFFRGNIKFFKDCAIFTGAYAPNRQKCRRFTEK